MGLLAVMSAAHVAYLVDMGSKVRSAAGVIIALLALALAFYFPFGFVTEYGGFGGGDLIADVGSYALVAVVAAPVVALGLWLTLRRGVWALLGGLVLSLAAALTGGMAGQAAHDRAAQVRDSACSADERSEFEGLGAIPTNGEYGRGNSDGSCSASFGGRTQSSLAELRQVIEGRGWKPAGTEAYERDGKRLQIAVRDEGEKGLDIVLKLE